MRKLKIKKFVNYLKIKNWKLKTNNGFTLVEVLIGSFLFLLVFLGIFLAYQLGIRVVVQSKNKVSASAIATGEIEAIRNLDYIVVGVDGDFPDGNLIASKVKTINGIDYTVETRVDYIIDDADGVSSPEDTCPNDYKKVEVKVSWQNPLPGNLKLVTDIAPKNLAQECSTTGGILKVNVFDAFGVLISTPLIEIKDPDTDNIIKTANPSTGTHLFSLPAGTYKVEVSKSGYSSQRTYSSDEVANPDKPHLSVIGNQLTENSFSIDELSSLTIETVGPDSLGNPVVSNAAFNLRGDKLLGTDGDGNPVYKYSQNHVSDDSGQITINNLEWDLYTFDPDLNLVDPPQPVSLDPGMNKNVTLVLEAANSLLLIVNDADTGSPVFSADARLYLSGYDVTLFTDSNGEAYFIPLSVGTYNLDVNASGYSSYSGTASVSGNVSKTINLNKIE